MWLRIFFIIALTRLAEYEANRFLNGKLHIDSLRGNLWHHLALSGIKLYDLKGSMVADVSNIVVDWGLRFPKWNEPQIVISDLQIERPQLYQTQLENLIKPSKPTGKVKNEPSA